MSVMVWALKSTERQARSTTDLRALVEQLGSKGVGLEFVDYPDGHPAAYFAVLAALAQFERPTLRLRGGPEVPLVLVGPEVVHLSSPWSRSPRPRRGKLTLDPGSSSATSSRQATRIGRCIPGPATTSTPSP